jgi:hypothetical protein
VACRSTSLRRECGASLPLVGAFSRNLSRRPSTTALGQPGSIKVQAFLQADGTGFHRTARDFGGTAPVITASGIGCCGTRAEKYGARRPPHGLLKSQLLCESRHKSRHIREVFARLVPFRWVSFGYAAVRAAHLRLTTDQEAASSNPLTQRKTVAISVATRALGANASRR